MKSVVNRRKIKIDQNKPLQANRVGKCGRKTITTPRVDRKLRDICLENRNNSATRLTTMMNDDGIKVSKRTVSRRLAEDNLFGRRPVKKPRLTEVMKVKRVKWTRQYRSMTVEDWSRVSTFLKPFCLSITIFWDYCNILQVCFSDESTFQILADKGSFI